jgi:inorganic pyrophosphatase
VKILGILGMLDDDETDWKLVAIDVTDKLAKKLNNIEDVEEEMPGYLDDTRKWFRNYKRPEGKGPNKFAFNGEFQGRKFAHEVNFCREFKLIL